MSPVDSPLRDRVIFVVGARRSGTTWLERILTAHPEVVGVPTETYIFSHGIEPLTERFQHANPSSPTTGRAFLPRAAFVDAMRHVVDRVFLETLERTTPDARYIVERTPWHASHIPLIAEVYPDARVINIMRDGRAVARSLVSMPWGPDTIAEAAAEWRDAVNDARGAGAALGDRYLEVLYEKLLRDPRQGTGEIFAWLGLDLPDETWERILLEAGAEFNVDPADPAIRSDKWRDQLSSSELRAFERIAGEQLDKLGYPRAAPAKDPRLPTLSRDRVRSLARTLRRPRRAARATGGRSRARLMHAKQIAAHELAETFERCVADANDAAARELLGARVRVRIDEGGRRRDNRGPAAIDDLLGTLARHREGGIHLLSGQVLASPFAVTTMATYELADGTRWARTLAYKIRGTRLSDVGLYLYELAPVASDEPPVEEPPVVAPQAGDGYM